MINFKKLAKLVDSNVILDVDHATQQELKVNYDVVDDEAWFLIAPEKYKIETDLAAIINAKAQIKLQSKKNSPFGNKKPQM